MRIWKVENKTLIKEKKKEKRIRGVKDLRKRQGEEKEKKVFNVCLLTKGKWSGGKKILTIVWLTLIV